MRISKGSIGEKPITNVVGFLFTSRTGDWDVESGLWEATEIFGGLLFSFF